VIENVSLFSVLEIGCSLRMLLDPALSFKRYGFSQSRYVALDSLSLGSSGRSNGRDGERPFCFSLMRKGREFRLDPFSDNRQPKRKVVGNGFPVQTRYYESIPDTRFLTGYELLENHTNAH
jgi:hypothetical protein